MKSYESIYVITMPKIVPTAAKTKYELQKIEERGIKDRIEILLQYSSLRS
jgi:hypothetical protein